MRLPEQTHPGRASSLLHCLDGPMAATRNGGENTSPFSNRVGPTHSTAEVAIIRCPLIVIASAPPAHSAFTTAWMSDWCTTSWLGSTSLRRGYPARRRG